MCTHARCQDAVQLWAHALAEKTAWENKEAQELRAQMQQMRCKTCYVWQSSTSQYAALECPQREHFTHAGRVPFNHDNHAEANGQLYAMNKQHMYDDP